MWSNVFNKSVSKIVCLLMHESGCFKMRTKEKIYSLSTIISIIICQYMLTYLAEMFS